MEIRKPLRLIEKELEVKEKVERVLERMPELILLNPTKKDDIDLLIAATYSIGYRDGVERAAEIVKEIKHAAN